MISDALLLKLHLAGLAFWFGVVGVEFLLERSRAMSREQGFAVARYHRHIDLYLEMPAFLLVGITGVALVNPAQLSGLYLVKVVSGAIAVLGNVTCLLPVILRSRAADRGDLETVIRHSRQIDRISLIAIPAGLVALGLGAFLV